MKEQEKADLGADSVRCFVDQFGEPDEYVTIILQVLMEELLNVSPISLPGQPQQKGNQTPGSGVIDEAGEFKDLQSNGSESAEDLGSEDVVVDQ